VFDHVIAALVHGSGYERLASPGCSDHTIRRRLTEGTHAGIGPELLRIGLEAYDRISAWTLPILPSTGQSRSLPAVVRYPAATRLTGANKAPNAPWPATVTGSRYTWSPHAPTTTTHPCSSQPWPESAT
jgi:hypothetical protein